MFLCQLENIPLVAQGYLLLGFALYFTGIKQARFPHGITFLFYIVTRFSLTHTPLLVRYGIRDLHSFFRRLFLKITQAWAALFHCT